MREKNKNTAKLILIIAMAAIAAFVILIIVKLASPGKMAVAADYVGQWTDPDQANASLDIWDTDGTNLIGMSSWQIDSNNAAFIDFEATTSRGGLQLINCKRTDMEYAPDGNVTETVVYENGSGTIKMNSDGTLVMHVEGDADPDAFQFTLEGAY